MRQTGETVSPMSNEGRNAYVIEHITQALLQLLQEKDLGEISISELCRRAGIGRASFYRNFTSREEILRAHIRGLFRQWVDRGALGENPPLSELLRALFAHFEEHRAFYELLNRRDLVFLLKDVLVGLCGLQPAQTKQEAYARAYVVYALYGWIEVWFQRGMQETAEEIAALFRERGL